MSAFRKGIDDVLASRSAVEGGSRLVAVLAALREAIPDADLPAPLRDTLEHLGRTPRT